MLRRRGHPEPFIMASSQQFAYTTALCMVAVFCVTPCASESCKQVEKGNCPKDYPIEAYQEYKTGDKQSFKMCCVKPKSKSDEASLTINGALSCTLTNVCTSGKDADRDLCSDKPTRYVNGTGYEWEESIRTECDNNGVKGVMPFCCTKNSTEGLLMTLLGAERHEFPYFARVTNEVDGRRHLCGGTIYNKRYIVTAAHCATDKNYQKWKPDGFTIFVGIGQSLLDVSEANKYKVEELITHPNASVLKKSAKEEVINDVAVFRLDRDIVFGDEVKALPIAPAYFNPEKFSDSVLILGFGTTNTLEQSNVLLKANTLIRKIENNIGPRKVLGSKPTQTDQFLVVGGYQNDVYSAVLRKGDSGGPAVCRDKKGFPVLCGIASFVRGDTQTCIDGKKPCLPVVYAKTAYFGHWIKTTAGEQDPAVFFKQPLYGDEVPKGMYEHQVHVTSPSGKRCGGTLISKDTVVTAAQCVADDDGNERRGVEVQKGITDLGKNQTFDVLGAKSIRILKGFKKEGEPIRGKRIVYPIGPNHVPGRQIAVDSYYTNDLAVIKLNGSYNIQQDKLPQLPDDDQTDETKYPVFGTEISFPRKLAKGGARLQRQFKLISQRDCQSRMARLTKVGYKIKPKDENVLCGVEMYSGGSTCDRELGGGLICKGKDGKDALCGVQIFRLCQFNVPNRFFNVGKQRKWIKS